jgi:D-alanine-D-alanine ligase
LGGVSGLKEMGVEVVFIAMHGPFGEDGCIQGMMEMEGIKYTGSGVLASALGMDKLRFRKVMEADGIAVPKYVVVEKRGNLRNVKAVLGRPPYFVKPHNQGSSVGITLVNKKTELRIAYNLARRYSKTVLVDECVEGIEVTASVLGDEEPRVLPLVEIVPKLGNYFDYRSKYHEGGADEIVPARISKELTKRVQETASDVYQLVGAKGFSRIDFILRDGRKPVVLEINTIPGLTPMSLFPKAARAAGISYSQLIARIIKYAIE